MNNIYDSVIGSISNPIRYVVSSSIRPSVSLSVNNLLWDDLLYNSVYNSVNDSVRIPINNSVRNKFKRD
jgi:hypothetical protein